MDEQGLSRVMVPASLTQCPRTAFPAAQTPQTQPRPSLHASLENQGDTLQAAPELGVAEVAWVLLCQPHTGRVIHT